MISRSQKMRLGIFIVVSTVILLVTIAIITGNKLLKKSATYYIRYRDISLTGLEIGSAVRYRGIRIGRIEDIYIDEKDITSIIVRVTIDPKVPIKEDTEAVVTLIGITGLKMIELQGGTNEAEHLPPKSFIKAGKSLVDSISGQAEVITQKLEIILNNLTELTGATRRAQVFRLIDNTSKSLESIQTLLDTNQVNIYNTMQNIETFTGRLDTFVQVSSMILADVREITKSPKLTNTLSNVEKISSELEKVKFEELFAKLAQTIEQTDRTFTHLDLTLLKSRHDILSSTELLRESLEYFNEFTRVISENPSLLLRSSQKKEIPER